MYKKILNIILIVLVFIYIIFEELVWEKFAKPLIKLISSLQIFTKLIPKILSLNSYVILIFFLSTFIIVELIGIYAGILFVSGHISSAVVIYILKVPVAAFIFWFFNITKSKLLEFKWFEYSYNYLLLIISKIKNSSIYIMIKDKSYELKKSIKDRYFSTRSKFKKKAIYIYKLIKQKIKL
ncbi:hypothetical protein [Arcobacter sp. s6]|jgi:hypothetical protein|uniref:hypothetical protein n=1 Tax=Arcobacter sp. s6 TaxID=3230363 RepID=UPI00349FF730